jgi:AcrR family transcriptional regulator
VLQAAVETLASKGFAHTSVSDIAERAGMSKGSVHYHFESKDDLLAHVLQACIARIGAPVRAAWEQPGISATERIAAAIGSLRETRESLRPELRVLVDLMAQAVHDEKLRVPIASAMRQERVQLLVALRASMGELGMVPVVAPELILRLLTALLDGLVLHRLFDPPSAEESDALDAALTHIAHGLFAASASGESSAPAPPLPSSRPGLRSPAR